MGAIFKPEEQLSDFLHRLKLTYRSGFPEESLKQIYKEDYSFFFDNYSKELKGKDGLFYLMGNNCVITPVGIEYLRQSELEKIQKKQIMINLDQKRINKFLLIATTIMAISAFISYTTELIQVKNSEIRLILVFTLWGVLAVLVTYLIGGLFNLLEFFKKN